jgi:hypothetical protein
MRISEEAIDNIYLALNSYKSKKEDESWTKILAEK